LAQGPGPQNFYRRRARFARRAAVVAGREPCMLSGDIVES